MTGIPIDLAKMARDKDGNKLLRDAFKSFLPDMFPEWDEDRCQKEIDEIVPQDLVNQESDKD